MAALQVYFMEMGWDAAALDEWVRAPVGIMLKGASRVAIDASTQGSLRTHGSGDRVLCPLCQVPVTMKHLIWECCYDEKPLPPAWQQTIQANENAML